MKDTPPVSVITSVYNGLPYLTEAVESILAQRFTDFEYLIVDDGSSDGSWDTLTDFARRDRRVRPLRNSTNVGFARSQNRSIAIARGEFIACQDQDDLSLPDRLARQVEFLGRHHDVGVVGAWPQFVDESGMPVETGGFHYETGPEGLGERLLTSYCVCGPSIMVRRRWMISDGPYDPDFRAAEDYELLLRLSERTRLANIPERLYLYRQHPESVSHLHRQLQMHNNARAREHALKRRYGEEAPERLRRHAGRTYLRAAYVAYGLGCEGEARLSLEGVTRVFPQAFRHSGLAGTELLRYLAAYPRPDADVFAASVFDEFLPRTQSVRRERSGVVGQLHMKEVFQGVRLGDRQQIRRHLSAAILADPRWLRNRGVWAIAFRQFFSRAPWPKGSAEVLVSAGTAEAVDYREKAPLEEPGL